MKQCFGWRSYKTRSFCEIPTPTLRAHSAGARVVGVGFSGKIQSETVTTTVRTGFARAHYVRVARPAPKPHGAPRQTRHGAARWVGTERARSNGRRRPRAGR